MYIMTYFSFHILTDIICNYQRPPHPTRIENNTASKQLSSLEAAPNNITTTRDIGK